jgi:putative sterol carrier protein
VEFERMKGKGDGMTGRRVSGPRTPTESFFTELAARGHESLLKSASGTVRFDLTDGQRLERWYVTMRNGEVTVSHKNAGADSIVRLDRKTFDGMTTGRVNAMAAVLRGDIVPEGDLGLVLLFQRLFPAPPRRGARPTTRESASP